MRNVLRHLLPCTLLLAAAPAWAVLPHGTVADNGVISCPLGNDPSHDPTPPVPPGGSLACHNITVTGCGPTATATVWIVKLDPNAKVKGTIFLHGGGGGTMNFTSGGSEPSSYRHTLESNYESDGFQLVDIQWTPNQGVAGDWELTTPPSTLAGACKPASVASWIFNNPGIQNKRRDIGFCAQGHSAGSGAMAYQLSFYGLKDYFDYVMLTAGPVFGRIDCGCDTARSTCGMQQICPQLSLSLMQSHLGYPANLLTWIDRNEGTSTCGQNTGSNPGDATWNADSVVGPGADLSYPKTGVSVWQCVNSTALNNAPSESSFFVNSASQLGQKPPVFCSSTGCTEEAIYQATINGVPATTVMSQTMTAGCIPRH
jgi:hypothetical protein